LCLGNAFVHGTWTGGGETLWSHCWPLV